jgi:hypothetical protein
MLNFSSALIPGTLREYSVLVTDDVLWYRLTDALKKHAACISWAATCLSQVLVILYKTTQHHIPKDEIFQLKKCFLPHSTLKINYLCHLQTAKEIMQYNVSVHENRD